ncbi:MAG: AraC family transcriptional regulator ligand-binding domain-containing protein [Rhodoferax sp.]|nr:AraC family transcriptional regulator ligand-binding domain-containing protein [Rhodoferax sp.]
MTSLIRAVALQGFEAAARSVGVDPIAQLARVDLPPGTLVAIDNFISYLAFIRLLENTAEAGHCADLGLRLASYQEAFIEGPLTLLMRYADTLNDALALGAQYGYVFSPAMRASLTPVAEHSELVDLTMIVNVSGQKNNAQTTEYLLFAMAQVLRWLSHGKIQPRAIMLPHARMGTPEHYARYMNCECRFNMPFAAIRMAASDLTMALPERNPLLLQMTKRAIAQNFGLTGHLISDRVRVLARQRMGVRRATQEHIASALSMHSKTLQRRLLAEGARFDALLDAERRDRFVELLMQPSRPSLAQIALMVGYSEQAALTRSCKRWFGCSPSVLRHQQLGS